MKYTVRNQDGQLEYSSFGQVEQAWRLGFVEPSDEILEEGKTMWRRADSFPLLAKARRHGDDVWNGAWFLWALIGVTLATISLLFLKEKEVMPRVIGFTIAIGDAYLLGYVTVRAQKRRKPHGK
jgi:hypothetical protein